MNTQEAQSPFTSPEALKAIETSLLPSTEYIVDTSTPLQEEYGYNVSAIITAGHREVFNSETGTVDTVDDNYYLIDLRSAPTDTAGQKLFRSIAIEGTVDFLLVSADFDQKIHENKGFKGLRVGEDLEFGRGNEQLTNRFDLKDSVGLSRNHFRLSLQEDGNVVIQDSGSSNGTNIKTGVNPIINGYRAHEPGNQNAQSHEQQGDSRSYEQQADAEQNFSSEQSTGDAFVKEVETVVSEHPDLDPTSAAEIIYQIGMIDLNNPEQVKQLRRSLVRRWHPDGSVPGSYDQRVREAATKFITLKLSSKPKG